MPTVAVDPSQDPVTRRALLTTQPNPAPRLDFAATLGAPLPAPVGTAKNARITVDYVPDRVLLDPRGFSRYITGLSGLPWGGPEALGIAILDDINNEIVPRWVRVTIQTDGCTPDRPLSGSHAESTVGDETALVWCDNHSVVLEDRQPHWNSAGTEVGLGFGADPGPQHRG